MEGPSPFRFKSESQSPVTATSGLNNHQELGGAVLAALESGGLFEVVTGSDPTPVRGTDTYFCLTADDCPILAGRGFSACLTIQERPLWVCAHLRVHPGLTERLVC